MKDPAFLFYPGDWMGGTQWMTFEQKGCYMELLILQFNCSEFTEAQAKQVLSICFDVAWPMLKQKFINDGEIYYNERLRIEIDKRKRFSESRRINGLGNKQPDKKQKAQAKHMPKHMEDENKDLNYFINTELNSVFISYLENRKKIKKPATDRAIELLVIKLNKFPNDEYRIQTLEKSITNNWTDIYELKNSDIQAPKIKDVLGPGEEYINGVRMCLGKIIPPGTEPRPGSLYKWDIDKNKWYYGN